MTDVPRPLLLGVSLKLYLDPEQSARWAGAVAAIAARHPAVLDRRVELFVLPSLPSLHLVETALRGTLVAVGAQDLFWQDRGAFTGGVSGSDLAAIGCRYVEVGHAERRRWFGEDDTVVARKLAAAVRSGLEPVLCVGERTRQDAAAAALECATQFEAALADVPPSAGASIVLAYEPEWAIGAKEAAGPEHVDAVCGALRTVLDAHPWLGPSRIIYGGSAQPGLLPRLGAGVDGLFLGRFAHDPAALEEILDEALAIP